MNDDKALHGLNCPRCGGMVPIPEGQPIVRCPYCDLRSLVRGERGVRRYQALLRVERDQALEALKRFLSRNWAIARDASRQAEIQEAFLAHVPFWAVWGRVTAWAFGEKKVGSGKDARYEPREVRVVQEMTWNGAALDVGEFGVTQVPLDGQAVEPYDSEELHQSGLVFEPVGSFQQAKQAAEVQFDQEVRRRINLDRISQLFVRTFRQRYGLVYYPLWVMRYLYKGRSFQVVADGYSGKVLYGKAPGNTYFRAAVLVAGMALGAFLAVDASTFAIAAASGSDSEGGIAFGLILGVVGLVIMGIAYRTFRYGEVYEFRSSQRKFMGVIDNPMDRLPGKMSTIRVRDIEQWINRLS